LYFSIFARKGRLVREANDGISLDFGWVGNDWSAIEAWFLIWEVEISPNSDSTSVLTLDIRSTKAQLRNRELINKMDKEQRALSIRLSFLHRGNRGNHEGMNEVHH
jgi:hypothetical protein